MAKKKAVKKAARPSKPKPASKASTASKSSTATKVVRKVVKKKPEARTEARKAPSVAKAPARVAVAEPEVPAARKKGVRKATITTGIRDEKPSRKLGRSRIPIDAPLDVVFQNDIQAREAFMFLGIHSIRELEHFNPDDLVLRLTGPAKLTVGRIRKILAMNNRCLEGDEEFALEFQELLSRPRD
jgi:hypothetical protein